MRKEEKLGKAHNPIPKYLLPTAQKNGNRIKEWRIKCGLSQLRLSYLADVNINTIKYLEQNSDISEPTIPVARKLAKVMLCPWYALYREDTEWRTEEKHPKPHR